MAEARRATLIERSALDATLNPTVERYEQTFGVGFELVAHFDADLLHDLHVDGPGPARLQVASSNDTRALACIERITDIANRSQTDDDRREYLRMLEDIYATFLTDPAAAAGEADLVISPRREGLLLADRIGCTPNPRVWAPHQKRMGIDDGMLVGIDGAPDHAVGGRIVAIDGAIASGVTLMAALQLAARPGATVEVFSCHGTAAGIAAVDRYADRLGVTASFHVGHISGQLNDHYYAVDPPDSGRVVLGDIGDTICAVA
jgi:hypothetical protein